MEPQHLSGAVTKSGLPEFLCPMTRPYGVADGRIRAGQIALLAAGFHAPPMHRFAHLIGRLDPPDGRRPRRSHHRGRVVVCGNGYAKSRRRAWPVLAVGID